jgi:hypothetical protein
MIDLDDDRLDAVLASVGRWLETSAPGAEARPAPVGDVGRRRRRPYAVAALAAAAVVTAIVVTVAPVREAVADWLGIGSTRIEIEPTPSGRTPTAGIQTGLPLVDRVTAEGVFDFDLPSDATALGPPAGFARMPEGGVLVVWPDGSTLWIHTETVDPDMYLKKLVGSAATVQRVDGLGDSALVVSGPHRLETPHRRVSASTTVLWRVGPLEHRLESDRSPEDLVTLAREIAAG